MSYVSLESEEVFPHDLENSEVEKVENTGKTKNIPDSFQVPADKEQLLNILFIRVNQIVRDLFGLKERIESLESKSDENGNSIFQLRQELESAQNIVLDAKTKEEIEDKVQDLEAKSFEVRNELKNAEDKVKNIKPDIEKTKEAMYKFFKAIGKGH